MRATTSATIRITISDANETASFFRTERTLMRAASHQAAARRSRAPAEQIALTLGLRRRRELRIARDELQRSLHLLAGQRAEQLERVRDRLAFEMVVRDDERLVVLAREAPGAPGER